MNHVIVTGAGGFVGQALVRRLLRQPQGPERLTVMDQRLNRETLPWLHDPRVHALEGDLADAAVLQAMLAQPVQQVFHLASVPGALAEREPALGLEANLMAPLKLLQALARRHAGLPAPRVVFASSIAVYGNLAPDVTVTDATPAAPVLSYGTHKRMIELLLSDFSRRGELDGVSLRLPGIVARPSEAGGHGSAFMSDLIRRGLANEPYRCPVSAQARCWWMTLTTCVDNLLHAAALPFMRFGAQTVVQPPVLVATVGEVVAAIEARVPGWQERLAWASDERIELIFGRLPLLDTPQASALGFAGDDLAGLLSRALRED